MKRILIFGGPGAGANSLARELAEQLRLTHFDLREIFTERQDHYLPVAKNEDEQKDFENRLNETPGWVLSGPICQWGENLTPLLEFVVFLKIARKIRLERWKGREILSRGENCLQEGSREFRIFNRFMYSAGQYDQAGPGRDSKIQHEIWLSKIQTPVLKLEGDASVQEWAERILEKI